MSEQSKFKPGDHVIWTSQAGGKSKTKQGIVIATVRANESWQLFIPDGFALKTNAVDMRPHESYLIQVDKSKRLYWPLVKYLKPVEPSPLERYKQESENPSEPKEENS